MRCYAVVVILLGLASSPLPAADRNAGDWSMSFALGGFKPEISSDSLRNRDGDLALAFSADYHASEHLAWGFDALWFSQDGDTPAHIGAPLFGTLDERASVTSNALSATVKWLVGSDRASAYLGGGIGLFRSRLRVTGSQLGIPGAHEAKSTDLGFQGIAGLALRTGDDTLLGLEWRLVKVDADFGSLAPGPVGLGGTTLLLTWRWEMPRNYAYRP